jgi:hypothetical protein
MVDKNLETDRDLTLEYELEVETPNNNFEIAKHENVLIDLIEQKRAADLSDKVRTVEQREAFIHKLSPFRSARCAANSTHKTFCSKSSRSMSSRTSETTPTWSSLAWITPLSSSRIA